MSDPVPLIVTRAFCSSSMRTESEEGGAADCRSARKRTSVRMSHPEDAELRFRNRRVEGGGERERKNGAGLRRIEDAVVPQARRGVVRASLGLVFLEGGALERGDLALRHRGLSGARELLLLHRGEHGG